MNNANFKLKILFIIINFDLILYNKIIIKES